MIPKVHHESLYDIPEEALIQCIKTVKRVGKGIKDAIRCDGLNIGMNNGRPAGQIVFHAHFHVIPRFLGDGLTHWPGKKMDAGQMGILGREIKDSVQKVK